MPEMITSSTAGASSRAGGKLPTPYYEREGVSLFLGDCREVLATLEAESVSACITSPPFWGLRKYECQATVWGGDPDCPHSLKDQAISDEGYAGRKRWQHDGVSRQETPEAWVKVPGRQQRGKVGDHSSLEGGSQRPEGDTAPVMTPDSATCSLCGAWRGWYGLEPTVAAYVEHTIEVLRAIRRVLRKDGVCWWDVDDSRSAQPSGNPIWKNWKTGGIKDASQDYTSRPPDSSIPAKSLCLIPQRVAIAAQEDGWIVRSQIIIPSWMPESAKDRPTDAYRTVLMLCKSKRYWYDAAAVRVAQSYQKPADVFGHNDGQRRDDGRAYEGNAPDGLRNLGNIWADIPPAAYPAAHFATFAVEEPELCIKASCPPDGLVLDPFVGTGTSCVAAVKLGRRAIGIDASEEYLKQAVTRLTVGDAGVRRIVAAERAGAKQESLL